MKKISVLLFLALLLSCPCSANVLTPYKAKVEQNQVYKSNINQLKTIVKQQIDDANKHDAEALASFYSNDFMTADGFNKEIYFKLVKETFETYPDISYKTVIDDIKLQDNLATVYVTEYAFATSEEELGNLKTIGELNSVSKTIYYFKKHGTVWLIEAEQILEEVSTLKYGKARYIDISLNAPKLVAGNKYYTTTLTVNTPKGIAVAASINKENIIYPQTKGEDNFRKLSSDNKLERVFNSNNQNLNEYNIASLVMAHPEDYDGKNFRIQLDGMAFIMTRVNVIPENKFIEKEDNLKKSEKK